MESRRLLPKAKFDPCCEMMASKVVKSYIVSDGTSTDPNVVSGKLEADIHSRGEVGRTFVPSSKFCPWCGAKMVVYVPLEQWVE